LHGSFYSVAGSNLDDRFNVLTAADAVAVGAKFSVFCRIYDRLSTQAKGNDRAELGIHPFNLVEGRIFTVYRICKTKISLILLSGTCFTS
jgi:hypothetical protein